MKDLFQALRNTQAFENGNNALVAEEVAAQVHLFKCGPRVDEDFKQCFGTLWRDTAVSQTEHAQNWVDSKAFRQGNHSIAAELVVV